ncbi:hypothetical protein BaRGS_00020748 [Batillaria attramentaria]|uniref:C1q domain-containing protein n=1 Tax=Batillaria attramentaria TaxID=370345 RepID=A0ABD0KL91_9CAEN
MQPYKRSDSFSFSTPLEKTGEGRPGYMTFQNGAEEIGSHLSVGSVLGAGDICLVNRLGKPSEGSSSKLLKGKRAKVMSLAAVATFGRSSPCGMWYTPSVNQATSATDLTPLVTALVADTANFNTSLVSLEKEALLGQDALTNHSQILDMLQKEQSSVKDAVKDLEASGANLTNTIFDLVSSDAGLSDRVAQVEASVVHETANISNAVADLQTQMAHDKASRRVAFHAGIMTDAIFQKGDDIIFDDDVTNIGRAYDANTGKFTAPLGGLYFFIATASTTTAGEQANMHMVHGSTTVAQCFIGFNTFYEMGSCHATLHLNAGESVWMKSSGSGSFFVLTTSFNGFLIAED